MAELMKLEIPRGWTISDNKFYDTLPSIDKDGHITNWHEGFSEDVLWIQETVFTNNKFEIPQTECFDIDLSFLAGQYVAKLRYTSQTETHDIEVIISKDRFEVRDKIETWLRDISNNYKDFKNNMQTRFPD